MKIAISATGNGPTEKMDSRFGRCPFFVTFDTETEKFDSFENPAASAAGGAGPAAARELAKNNVELVITGHVGTNAEQALSAAAIKVITDFTGTVQEVLDAYLLKDESKSE